MRMLSVVLIGYGLIVIFAAVFQRRLIYFPSHLPAVVAERAAAQNGFLPWRGDSGQFLGWKASCTGSSSGSLLIFHGNAGCALDRDYLAGPAHEALPIDVYVLEYPGYGARTGSPSLNSLLAAATEALGTLPTNLPVYLVSESIGAGIAAHLANVCPDRVRGILMFAPYDDLGNVGQAAMPFFPVKLILRDRYRPALWLQEFHGPLQVVLAGADEIIPRRFGQRLFDGYAGPKRLQIIAGARHNEIAGQAPAWWQEVFAFWQSPSP